MTKGLTLCFIILIRIASHQFYAFGFLIPQAKVLSKSPLNAKSSLNEIDSLPTSLLPIATTGDNEDLRKDLLTLKVRIEKLEKVASSKSFFDLSNLFDGKSIGLNKKTIEVCSIFSFFIIGSILSRTVFDGLWFVGGLLTAWWASVAINTSTSGGTIVRRVGIQLAQFLVDVQEKVNQVKHKHMYSLLLLSALPYSLHSKFIF